MQDTTMNSSSVTAGDSPTPGSLLDEFEEAFQSCFAPLIKEDPLNGINHDELKTSAESNAQRFFDLAYRMESVFLQKRFLLSVQRPEVLIQEENNEIRTEILKKDDLIKKHLDKLSDWQATLADITSRVGSVQAAGARTSTPYSNSPSSLNPLTPSTPQVNLGGLSPGSQLSHPNTPVPLSSMSSSPLGGQAVGGGGSLQSINQSRYSGMSALASPTSQMHAGGSMGTLQGPITGPPSNMSTPLSQIGTTGSAGSMPSGSSMNSTNVYANINDGMGALSGLQGPLAFLEKTTTNIGISEARR